MPYTNISDLELNSLMKIIYTSIYLKKIDKLLNQDEKIIAEDEIAKDPFAHPIIQGSGGIRKARAKRGNHGKSGGIRIIYYYLAGDQSIYMLTAYAKNEVADLSPSDKSAFRKLVESFKKGSL